MPTTDSKPEVKLVNVELDNPISINGVKYAGNCSVPENVAADLKRMDKDQNKYLAGLNKNVPVNGSLGSVSAA